MYANGVLCTTLQPYEAGVVLPKELYYNPENYNEEYINLSPSSLPKELMLYTIEEKIDGLYQPLKNFNGLKFNFQEEFFE